MPDETYKKIATAFHVGKQHYYGIAVLSPDTLYLVMLEARNAVASGVGGAVGGLVGGLIAAGISAASAKKKERGAAIRLSDLGPAITDHPEWPLRGKPKFDNKEVLVIPRDSIDMIVHPSFTNLLKFTVADTKFSIAYIVFRGAAIRDFLKANGWRVTWKGEIL